MNVNARRNMRQSRTNTQRPPNERERRAAEAEERAEREGRAAGLHDERAAERERELD